MNKAILATVIVVFLLAGLAGALLLSPADDQPIALTPFPTTFAPIDDSRYQQIGHEDDILKGAAFTAPVENTDIRPPGWSDLPIQYDVSQQDADLVLTLDQQLYEQLVDVVRDYAHQQQLKIAINKGTCGVSASSLGKKKVDIGGFCCAPGSGDRYPGLKYHTLGIASLAMLVNPVNQTDNLSSEQVRQVFNGQLKKWRALDAGPDLEQHRIDVVTRLHCKTRPGHWTLILSGQDQFSPTARETGDIPYMLAEVNRNKFSIGYETLFMVQREQKQVKLLTINDIHPANLDALARGYYPFYRVYNLTTWHQPERKPAAEKLVDYLVEYVEQHSATLNMASLAQLRANGWQIHDGELVGEPGAALLSSLE